MKEMQPESIQSNREGLTKPTSPSTLEGKGNIFMAESGGDQSPKQPDVGSTAPKIENRREQPAPVKTELSTTTDAGLTRRLWEKHYKGLGKSIESLPFDERQSVELAIKEGGLPKIAGGAEAVRITDDLDPRLQNIARELNAEVNRVGAGNPLDPNFVQEQRIRIRRLLDDGQVDAIQANRLLGELNTWMAEAISGDVERVDYTALNKEALMEVINNAPSIEASHFPEPLLKAAMQFKETREMLINKILFKSFEDKGETNSYEINLYAQSNLDTLLGYLSREERTRYDYYFSLRTAAQLFHTMNATVIGGNLDEFIKVAERINYQHFELMQKIPGVSEAMRLYEEKYQEFTARDGRLTTQGYKQLKEEVIQSFLLLNNAGLVKSEFESERDGLNSWKMEDWEIRRALNVARTFYNITFRGAELIASGQVPTGEKRYASFPQESAARIMNWIELMTYRFQIAEPRGGLKFLQMVKDNYKSFLRSRGRKLGINKIKEFGGMNTDELEAGGMFGTSGIYSSWRAETMAFPVIKINIGGSEVTIREWLDSNAEQIEAARKSRDQDRLYNVFRPLIDNSNLGIGILLKHIIFSEKVGYKSRKALWERVSENNLPLMINYLSRIQFENEGQQQNRITLLRQNDATNWDEVVRQETLEDGTTLDITKWDVLKEKIFLQHHKNIKRAAGINVDDVEDQIFDADEQRLRNLIINEGRDLAPQLADIVFPYVPFMNDVPFELLDYAGPGEEFFKRRTGGDFPSFSKGQGAFISIMNNPGGLGHEKLLEQLDIIVKGIESPQGTRDAQERLFPMFEACIDWIATRPWQRQAFIKFLAQTFRIPTSIAQKFSGPDAQSLDELKLSKIIDESIRIGILPVDLASDLKKKKNLKFLGLLWSFIRDIIPMSVLAAMLDFGQKTTKEKGA